MKLAIILSLALHLSSASDTFSTRRAIGNNGREANPIIAPFVNNSTKLFIVQQAAITPLSVMLIKYPKNKKLKIIAIGIIAGQLFVAKHNIGVKK